MSGPANWGAVIGWRSEDLFQVFYGQLTREVDSQDTMIVNDDGVGLPEDLDIGHPSAPGIDAN